MISIQDHRLVLTGPESFTVITERPLDFAYVCPSCSLPVLGLMNFQDARHQRAPRNLRLESKEESYLHLNRCYPRKSQDYLPPDFEGQLIRSGNGELGQLFFENRHFRDFETSKYQECKFTQVLRGPTRQAMLQALLKQLVAVYTNEHVDRPGMEQALQDVEMVDFAWDRIHTSITESEDRVGGRPPVYLISRHDLHMYDLRSWVRTVVARHREMRKDDVCLS